MRTIVAVEHLSLDGVMQAPGGRDEDTRGGFKRGGWAHSVTAGDEGITKAMMAGQKNATAMLFGHRTYEQLVGFWLKNSQPNPFTKVIRDTPKYVASRSSNTRLAYPNSTLLGRPTKKSFLALKNEGQGEIVVLGSGVLVRALAKMGLVDRYVLTIVPVVLGRGTRLFDTTPTNVKLERSYVSKTTGVIVATYAVQR